MMLVRLTTVCLIVLLASCNHRANKPGGPGAGARGTDPAQARERLLARFKEATRIEFTIGLHKEDGSHWRVGPIIIDRPEDLARINELLVATLHEVAPNRMPYGETITGTSTYITLFKAGPGPSWTELLRLSPGSSLDFFADERWTATLGDGLLDKELYDIAREESKDHQRLFALIEPAPNPK